ncbi:MAG: NAD(P)H-dependent oxidoreductase [Bryobacter sp.]|nr:NAD(P)H-dependent oxidoreductase [Bryobacter sp.]
MAKLLYIEASPRKERSHSIFVANEFLTAYKQAHPEDTVEVWDLWKETLPEFDGHTIAAKYRVLGGEDQDSPERLAWQQIELIANRFKAADKFLFSLPMWNFGIPYKLKHLIDVVAQPGMTFGYDPEKGYFGLVTGKKAAVIYARGGAYAAGTPAAAMDFQKPYFEAFLRFVGITEFESIVVEGTLFGPEAAAQAREHGVAEAKRIAAVL